ncbi:MAG: type II toxin-antitoxin system PemK/MazF family toxin [Candidatus Dormibacteria bacterium]
MSLLFQPKPRSIVFCNFAGFVEPEIVKRRPVVVLAVHKRNSKLVTVVPLSTTAPDPVEAHHYRLKQNPLPGAQEKVVWAKCDMVAVVSIERLDLVHTGRGPAGKRQYLRLQIGQDQFDAIRQGVASALGLLSLTGPKPPAP